jgi:hypothetical protein
MAARFSRLRFDSFEDRSLPSATVPVAPEASEPVPAQVTEVAAVAEISPTAYLQTVLSEQANASAKSESDSNAPRYEMIPLGFNRAGNLLVLIVKTSPAPVDHSIFAGTQAQSFRADTQGESLPPDLRGANASAGSNPSVLVAEESFEIPATVDGSKIVAVREIPLTGTRANPSPVTPGTLFASLSPVAGTDWNLGESFPPMTLPEEPSTPDAEFPQATTDTPKSPSITVEELGILPLSGFLPFNLPHLEQAVSGLLSQVRALSDTIAGELGESSDAWWLAAAALTAGGTIWTVRSTRPDRGGSQPARTRRTQLAWQGADGARVD